MAIESGRVPCGKFCKADASRWITSVTWTEAETCGPVYGYLILIANREGYVNVLDLRLPEGESPGDVTEKEQWKRTRDALKRHDAKWWAYLPLSPPVNVDAVPLHRDENGKWIATEANDPPKEDLVWARNLPHDFLK